MENAKSTIFNGDGEITCQIPETNKVTVRWLDGYLEEFEATEVRFGSGLLWMRLSNKTNRHIPLVQVRWFSLENESHQALN